MPSSSPITVLTTGGTIDKVYAKSGELEIGPAAVEAILERSHTGLEVTISSVITKDSLDMTDADRAALAERLARIPDRRVVVTHGTDTMTDTADQLSRDSALAEKTVVLTGAMQPAAMRDSDAPFNVGAALLAVQLLPAGVYICMSGRVFPAGSVVKDRSLGQFVDA